MKKILVLTIIIGFVFAVNAKAAVRQGDDEISIFGNYIGVESETGGKEDTYGGGLGVSHFYSDTTSAGLQGIGSWSSDVDLYLAGGNLKYHFMPSSCTVPYVGVQANYGYTSNSDSSDGFMWGPVAGIKFFMDERTSLFAEYQYQIYDGGLKDSIDDSDAVLVGLSWKF